ncbi:unnamed protein product [Heligmosomoides polygyrus]|uniref:Ground-like domain-containing protein n=1 Tax=Heligmosomoides polygyrus TaxID=6339 RepID=A0A183FW08_HELPZ|nr:unnamed protein product [Heligmosomoides polygyrus]
MLREVGDISFQPAPPLRDIGDMSSVHGRLSTTSTVPSTVPITDSFLTNPPSPVSIAGPTFTGPSHIGQSFTGPLTGTPSFTGPPLLVPPSLVTHRLSPEPSRDTGDTLSEPRYIGDTSPQPERPWWDIGDTSSEPRHLLTHLADTSSKPGRMLREVGDISFQPAPPLRDIGDMSSFRPFQTVFHSSSDVKGLFVQNIDANPSSSKRKIQKAATDEIGGLFDVICSSHDFSYLANTQLFCEAGNDDVTCFAFLHSLIQ